MEKLLFSLGLILSGLTFGFILQMMDRNGTLSLPIAISDLRKILQKIGLLLFMPISFTGAVWVVSISDLRVAFLPLIEVTALAAGGLLGIGLARMLQRSPKKTGVLFCCGSFANVGSIGGLVCYMFLGEAGFALLALYKMFEDIVYYTIGFPLARYYSGALNRQQSFGRRILEVVADPFVAAALCSLVLGLSLNLSGTPRPELFETVTALSIPIGTLILIVSIGLGMHVSHIGNHLKECLGIALVKFALVPLIACFLAYLLGLHLIADGLPFKVVLILSSMPVAFNALIAASIYDLDLDLANSCWLVTTIALVVVLPWLYFLLSSSWLP